MAMESKEGTFNGKVNRVGKKLSAEKSSEHYAAYHYPSGTGSKSPIMGGHGPSKQHTSEYMAQWRHVSKKWTKSPMQGGK